MHYHFAGKAELGEALIARYAARFGDALAEIDRDIDDAPAKLDAYADLYLAVLRDRRMCLCGMLAAEYQTLPEPMRQAVMRFFDDNETWLADVLELGRRDGTLRYLASARDAARLIISGLEGAMLVTRPYGDLARFEGAARGLLAGLRRRTRPREPARADEPRREPRQLNRPERRGRAGSAPGEVTGRRAAR